MRLIESKIPVLIEKPISANYKDAEIIANNSSKFRTPAAVAYNLRYLPSTEIIKKYLDNEFLGRIFFVNIEAAQYLPDWRPNKDYRDTVSANLILGGGVLLELSHELDLMQWFFGSLNLVSSRLSSSKELNLEVEDCADLILETSNNTSINVHLDFLQRDAIRKYRFVGTLGSIEWDLINQKISLFKGNKSELIYHDNNYNLNNSYIEMLKDFIRMINGQNNTLSTLNDAMNIVHLIDKSKFMNSSIIKGDL